MDKKGWSWYQLSLEAELTPKTLYKFRDGKTKRLRRSTRNKIAKALELDLDLIPD